MSMAVHCDRDGCGAWQTFGAEVVGGWYKLSLSDDLGDDPSKTKHFDTLDCLLRWTAANSTPTETYGA